MICTYVAIAPSTFFGTCKKCRMVVCPKLTKKYMTRVHKPIPIEEMNTPCSNFCQSFFPTCIAKKLLHPIHKPMSIEVKKVINV